MKHISLDNINRVVAASSGEATPADGISPRVASIPLMAGVIDAFPEPGSEAGGPSWPPQSPSRAFQPRGSGSPATSPYSPKAVALPTISGGNGGSPVGSMIARSGASNGVGGARGGLRSPATGGSNRLPSPPSRLGSRAGCGSRPVAAG